VISTCAANFKDIMTPLGYSEKVQAAVCGCVAIKIIKGMCRYDDDD